MTRPSQCVVTSSDPSRKRRVGADLKTSGATSSGSSRQRDDVLRASAARWRCTSSIRTALACARAGIKPRRQNANESILRCHLAATRTSAFRKLRPSSMPMKREATARHLAGHGAKLVLGARCLERLRALAEELLLGHEAAVPTDVTQYEQVRHLVDHAVQSHGRIDVIINNAGLMPTHRSSAWHRSPPAAGGVRHPTTSVFGRSRPDASSSCQ
jgi:short chain dehydrogenase